MAGHVLALSISRPARGVIVVQPAGTVVQAVSAPGQEGPPGRDGTGTTLAYPIGGVASFTVTHGLPYTPQTTIVASSGEQIETDTYFSPGQITLMFAQPFTGILYLG